MRIALFGHGAMGHLVEAQARAAGHEVAHVFTSKDETGDAENRAAQLVGVDAAIDFSVAEAVVGNVEACAHAGVAIVVGTTGWRERTAHVRALIEEHDGALVYGANFSVGVNLFYRVVAHAAELFSRVESYAPFIEEAHHARKRDAPSGTALVIRDLLAKHYGEAVPVASTRAGHIPGTHRVGFDSASDQVTLIHTARSREGFASGALLAARWIAGRRGVYEFSEVIEELLTRKEHER